MFSGRDVCDFIFVDSRANPVNKLYRRTFINERNVLFQRQKRENDLFFSFVTVALAERIGVVDDAYYHYRMMRQGSLQTMGGSDSSPLLWINAVKAVKERISHEGELGVFAFGLLRALLGTGVRSVLKRTRDEDIRILYSALREEILEMSVAPGVSLEKLTGMDKCVWELVSENDTPTPLLAFLGRYYMARSEGRRHAHVIAFNRKLHRLHHVVRKLFAMA